MLKDSTGKELSLGSLYKIGEIEVEYSFYKYINFDKTRALFSTNQLLTNGDPHEHVLSQVDIDSLKVYPVPDQKDKNSQLESSISQS